MRLLFVLFCSILVNPTIGQYSIKGSVQLNGVSPLSQKVELFISENSTFYNTKKDGSFHIRNLNHQRITLTLYSKGYKSITEIVDLDILDSLLNINLLPLSSELERVDIFAQASTGFGFSQLKAVEDMAIYAGKKSEVVDMQSNVMSKANNNPRQVYGKVAGLNIWENDGAGIQLGIGGRGLSPSRVSNFNTRQNGYDISADALGYPESYYSPSAEAIDRIEIVRGAASLQYGTQFGGFLNFKLKDGPDTAKFELNSRQSVGSFGLINSFNSIGGNHHKLKYYAFYQHKQGNGWRENSGFNVHNAHFNLQYDLHQKFKISLEYTFMSYLAQQPGGLTDFQFLENPQQSIRSRNWFQVGWNLAALKLKYKINETTKIDSRIFTLLAGRDAVGNLGPITRIDDPDSKRNLLVDDYLNIGIENRLMKRYVLKGRTSIALIGMRYYKGFTERKQGFGTASDDANFRFENNNRPEDSFYEFPSENVSLFAENVFYITPKVSITPGVRYEYIDTQSEGFYVNRSFNLAGQVINENSIEDNRRNVRDFVLMGIGYSYKPHDLFEFYSNYSQNYRSINFNDMRIVNPNYQVDTNLTDESGFSIDLGIRGHKYSWLSYDVNVFYLKYNDRIGEVRITDPVLFKPIRFRTNVSDSRSLGIESYVELSLTSLMGKQNSKSKMDWFSNLSIMEAKYINSEETAYQDKYVELVPSVIFRTGLKYSILNWSTSLQYSYTDEHFTDATNAEFTSNAVNGLVPSYEVVDFSLQFKKRQWLLEFAVNNLLNATYFTRRAAGYPGPGIIPAEARNMNFTVALNL